MPYSDQVSPAAAIDASGPTFLYHPRICARTGQLIGIEASPHWRSEGKLMVEADAGMSLSADDGRALWTCKLSQLLSDFDYLKQHRRHAAASPGPFISLQLAPRQLESDEWAIQLLDALSDSGIAGKRVEVLLIDKGPFVNGAAIEWSFEVVRRAGVALALGNFPGGASSFLKLARYKFDKVRIDTSMVPSAADPIALWSRRRALLNGLIGTIRSVGASAILNGIDKEIQFNFFRELPAGEWQGAYWGAGMEFREIVHRMHIVGAD